MKLVLYTWDQLLDAEFPHGQFFLDPYIPAKGVTFLFGAKSLGKSPIQWSWARAIAAGEPWLGLPTRKGRVLLIEVDQPASSVQPRLRRVGARALDAFFLAGVGNLGVPNVSVAVADALRAAREEIQPNVVFFNTLHNTTNLNLNEGQTVQLVYAYARSVFPDASLVFIHHPKKEPPSNVHINTDEMHSGSHSWRDDAQVALHLQQWVQRAKGGRRRSSVRLRMTGSQVSPLYKPLPLLLGPDGVSWSSPLVDELTALADLRGRGFEGAALDKEAVKCGIVGSVSTARLRRLRLEAGFPGSPDWLGLDHEEEDSDGHEEDAGRGDDDGGARDGGARDL